MIIRSETEADHQTIRRLITAAFGQSLEADLVDGLRADGDVVLSLVAEEEGAITGQALFSSMDAPLRALGLGPVTVLPERQRSGVGSALIRTGIEEARAQGWEAIFVLGEPDYYRRFGFDGGLAARFDCTYASPYLMALGLTKDLPAGGHVAYAPAFARLPQ
jgi:putative acetyltransferase